MQNARTLFDYSKLKGRITEKCQTKKIFAGVMGFSEGTLISKLSGKTYFNQKEILTAMSVLDIDPIDVSAYFFNQKVL